MRLKNSKAKIANPKDVAKIFAAILAAEEPIDRDKEHFWVLGVNTDMTIKYIELVSLGILDMGLVHPRETYRMAILEAVSGILPSIIILAGITVCRWRIELFWIC